MIAFDDARWPIVTISKQGRFTTADATAHVIAFDAYFRRREAFVVAVVYGDEAAAAYEHDPAADAIHARWYTANGDALALWCRAVAAVAEDPRVRRQLAARLGAEADGSSQRTVLFATTAAADAWLADRLAAPRVGTEGGTS